MFFFIGCIAKRNAHILTKGLFEYCMWYLACLSILQGLSAFSQKAI